MSEVIYLDYMATTPVDPKVIDAMLPYLGRSGHFGNPSSVHVYGQQARVAVEEARCRVAALIQADASEIIFTSGATESNNLAILGAATFYQRQGKHVITTCLEHASVLESFKQLERMGFEVTYLKPNALGLIDQASILSALRQDTILVSCMHVNHEIGVIHDIEKTGQLLKERGVLFHVDAAQSLGKIALDVTCRVVDLISLSAHKIYGPKGIGALYRRANRPLVHLNPQSFGGGQEARIRSGTLPTHQIVGMGEACVLAKQLLESEYHRVKVLRDRLYQGIMDLPGLTINGSLTHGIPHQLNIRFKGLSIALLAPKLTALAFSTQSTCSASKHAVSYVLQALGLNATEASSSLRLSIGRYTTVEEIDRVISVIREAVLAIS